MKIKFLHSDFGLLFWLHISLILFAYVSWVLFSWWWVVLGSIALWVQYWAFKGCFLTFVQRGRRNSEFAFLAYYFEKCNIKVDKAKLTFFIRHIVPVTLIVLAIAWQVFFDKAPLIF